MYKLLNQMFWSYLETYTDVNLAIDRFYCKIEEIMNATVPLTKQPFN